MNHANPQQAKAGFGRKGKLMAELTTYTILRGGVNDAGWWVYSLRNEKTGRVVDKRRKAVAQLRREGRIIEETPTCDKCDGRGWYLERFSDSHRTQCSKCGGHGKVKANG